MGLIKKILISRIWSFRVFYKRFLDSKSKYFHKNSIENEKERKILVRWSSYILNDIEQLWKEKQVRVAVSYISELLVKPVAIYNSRDNKKEDADNEKMKNNFKTLCISITI